MTSIQEQHKLASEWHAAMAKGEPFEVEESWKGKNEWGEFDGMFVLEDYDYRRKPTPKLIPWSFEDITPEIAGAWFHGKQYKAFANGVIFETDGMEMSRQMYVSLGLFGQNNFVTYSEALEQLEYSTDLKTWKPCGKVSE